MCATNSSPRQPTLLPSSVSHFIFIYLFFFRFHPGAHTARRKLASPFAIAIRKLVSLSLKTSQKKKNIKAKKKNKLNKVSNEIQSEKSIEIKGIINN